MPAGRSAAAAQTVKTVLVYAVRAGSFFSFFFSFRIVVDSRVRFEVIRIPLAFLSFFNKKFLLFIRTAQNKQNGDETRREVQCNTRRDDHLKHFVWLCNYESSYCCCCHLLLLLLLPRRLRVDDEQWRSSSSSTHPIAPRPLKSDYRQTAAAANVIICVCNIAYSYSKTKMIELWVCCQLSCQPSRQRCGSSSFIVLFLKDLEFDHSSSLPSLIKSIIIGLSSHLFNSPSSIFTHERQ